jgi:hypothetical protein
MRVVGIVVGLGAAVAVAACLDAGMRPSSTGRPTARPGPIAKAPRPAPAPAAGTAGATEDPSVPLVPAVATVPTDPPAPNAPPPAPAPTSVAHTSPNGVPEFCTLLPQFPFTPPDVTADPKTKRWFHEEDFEDVAKLCAMDLYIPEPADELAMVGVCPKLHWSTPALELFDLSDGKLKKATFQEARCGRWKNRGRPKLAKWKPYVYDKEPESAIFYFHFSRLLGNAALVYPATWRTVDRAEFHAWSKTAIDYISRLHTTATPINGWNAMRSRHKKAHQDPDVINGSLAKNPRGEKSHSAFIKWSPDVIKKEWYFKILASKKPIEDLIELDDVDDPKAYHKNVQRLAYVVDFTNLVVLDSLFNQRDRAGNISAKKFVYFTDDAGNLRWKKELAEDDPRPRVTLERLLLKDNDDGMEWDMFGKMNSSRLVPDLRHFDPTMFARVQWLAGLMRGDDTKDQVKSYFTDGLHLPETSYEAVKARFLKLADRLARWHDMGRLQLDLDLAPFIAKAPALPPDPKKDKKDKGKKKGKDRDKDAKTASTTPAAGP